MQWDNSQAAQGTSKLLTPEQAASAFVGKEHIASLVPLHGGNINDSYLLRMDSGEKRLFQRLNAAVFPEPELVMANLRRITAHFNHWLAQSKSIRALTWRIPALLYTPDGRDCLRDEDGSLYRLLLYFDQTRNLRIPKNTVQAEEIGAALGFFHRVSADVNMEDFAVPLPGFHDSQTYLKAYDKAQSKNPEQNPDWMQQVIAEKRGILSSLSKAKKSGIIQPCLIHGDPKAANFLFALDADQVLSLIDLDTVGPGLRLQDIADCLRSSCNTAGEEAVEPDTVCFEMQYCKALLRGYFAEAGELLSAEERKLIPDALLNITLELGIRFLSDYLEGNPYFKIRYPEHNLDRAAVQFRFFQDIERHIDSIRSQALAREGYLDHPTQEVGKRRLRA